MNLGWRIEKFLKATNMPPARFGREAAGDPRLVFDVRNGREVGPRLAGRVLNFMSNKEASR